MSIAFPPELAEFVAEKLANGHYPSEDDLVVDAVRRLRDYEYRENFKAELREQAAALDRGEGIVLNGDEELRQFLNKIDAEVDAERAAAKRAGS